MLQESDFNSVNAHSMLLIRARSATAQHIP